MECCSSTASSDCEEDLENVCAILAADTVTVRRKMWVHDINMKRNEKGEFHHLVNLLKPNDLYIYMSYRSANLQSLHFKYLFNEYTY